jgi:hypothetical protein
MLFLRVSGAASLKDQEGAELLAVGRFAAI